MELTPDLLLEAKFSSARRGYDMAEVDDFLERCAEGLDVLLARLQSEFERAERAEAAYKRVEADRGEPGVAAEAPTEVAAAEAPSAEEAPPAEAKPVDVDEPMRVLVMAERTAEATITEARTEAERIRQEAESVANRQRSEAERLLTSARADAEAEARKAGDAARREVEGEVNQLRTSRDELATDVRSLQRWLDEQRGRMRTTARELQRLIDDPTALREFAAPELTADEDLLPGAAADEAVNGDEPAGESADAGTFEDPEGDPTQAVPVANLLGDEADANNRDLSD